MTVEEAIEELQQMPKHTRLSVRVYQTEFGKGVTIDYEVSALVFEGNRVTVRPGKQFSI